MSYADTRVSQKKVLIVDDEDAKRDALSIIFDLKGFDVVGEAANVAEALSIASSRQPDVVILDCWMAGHDMRWTAKMLRDIVPAVKVVAFSPILSAKPTWADAHLDKDGISELDRMFAEPFAEVSSVEETLDTSPYAASDALADVLDVELAPISKDVVAINPALPRRATGFAKNGDGATMERGRGAGLFRSGLDRLRRRVAARYPAIGRPLV